MPPTCLCYCLSVCWKVGRIKRYEDVSISSLELVTADHWQVIQSSEHSAYTRRRPRKKNAPCSYLSHMNTTMLRICNLLGINKHNLPAFQFVSATRMNEYWLIADCNTRSWIMNRVSWLTAIVCFGCTVWSISDNNQWLGFWGPLRSSRPRPKREFYHPTFGCHIQSVARNSKSEFIHLLDRRWRLSTTVWFGGSVGWARSSLTKIIVKVENWSCQSDSIHCTT